MGIIKCIVLAFVAYVALSFFAAWVISAHYKVPIAVVICTVVCAIIVAIIVWFDELHRTRYVRSARYKQPKDWNIL